MGSFTRMYFTWSWSVRAEVSSWVREIRSWRKETVAWGPIPPIMPTVRSLDLFEFEEPVVGFIADGGWGGCSDEDMLCCP